MFECNTRRACDCCVTRVALGARLALSIELVLSVQLLLIVIVSGRTASTRNEAVARGRNLLYVVFDIACAGDVAVADRSSRTT